MSQTRKKRSDSISMQLELQNIVKTRVKPPMSLSSAENSVFNGLIDGLPRDYWETYRVRTAANLAKLTIKSEQLMRELDAEGVTIYNDRGTPVMNPKQNALNSTLQSMSTMTRMLGLSASQRGITEGKSKPLKAAESKARSAHDKAEENSLLA